MPNLFTLPADKTNNIKMQRPFFESSVCKMHELIALIFAAH